MAEHVHSRHRHDIEHGGVGDGGAHPAPENHVPSPGRARPRRGPGQARHRARPTQLDLPPGRGQGDLPAPPIHATLPPARGR